MRILTAARLLWRACARKEEYARYLLAERLTALVYPTYVFSEYGRLFLDDERFRETFVAGEDSGNLRSLDRKYVLDQLVRLAVSAPGDTAECGVYRGLSSLFVCQRTQGMEKCHHLFDSFEGLSAPGPEDGDYWQRGDLSAGTAGVRHVLADFDFVEFHEGWIPERFQDVSDRSFCFVHVDVDLYQPTRDALEFFYERLSPGGILLCDDYGFRSCPGATRAFEEVMATHPEPIIHLPTGQGFVIRAHPSESLSPRADSGRHY